MLDADVAHLLEDFASAVIRLPGLSRNRPHAFAEAKDSLYKAMTHRAAELRNAAAPRRMAERAIATGTFRPGAVRVRGRGLMADREVSVEIRRKADHRLRA